MPGVVSAADFSVRPESIWDLMCDPRRYPEFVEGTERMVDVPNTAFEVGYTYKEYGGIRPFVGETEWRVTELDPPRHQVHIGSDGMMTIRLEINCTEIPGGTRLTQSLDLKAPWYMRPINAILWLTFMRKRVQASLDGTTANAKRILETASQEPVSVSS